MLQSNKIEGTGFRIQPKNRRQHKGGCDYGVQEKLHCRINLPPVPVHSDEQRHGNQGGFPEEIEEEEIERNENSNQRRLKHQEQNKKLLDSFVYRVPGDKNAKRGEKRREHDQPKGNPVYSQVEV